MHDANETRHKRVVLDHRHPQTTRQAQLEISRSPAVCIVPANGEQPSQFSLHTWDLQADCARGLGGDALDAPRGRLLESSRSGHRDDTKLQSSRHLQIVPRILIHKNGSSAPIGDAADPAEVVPLVRGHAE